MQLFVLSCYLIFYHKFLHRDCVPPVKYDVLSSKNHRNFRSLMVFLSELRLHDQSEEHASNLTMSVNNKYIQTYLMKSQWNIINYIKAIELSIIYTNIIKYNHSGSADNSWPFKLRNHSSNEISVVVNWACNHFCCLQQNFGNVKTSLVSSLRLHCGNWEQIIKLTNVNNTTHGQE